MRILVTILLFLFASCSKAQQFLGVEYNPPFATLIDNGNFAPATSQTPELAKFEAFRYGWFFNLNMNEFQGSYVNAINAGAPPSPASRFTAQNVNVAKWADSAAAAGVDYAMLTVINEYGFKLWPSKTPYNMEQISMNLPTGPFTSPYYPEYSVLPDYADTAIVAKFVTEFRARGIEPVFYINSVNDYNILGGWIPRDGVTAQRQNEWINYMCRLMQEMIIRFGVKYLWIDYGAAIPADIPQRYYNAVKSVDPGCMIIGNVGGDASFLRFPYDIQSHEEHALDLGSTAYQSSSRTHGGVTYYIPQEIISTPYRDMSQWYYYCIGVDYLPTVSPYTNQPPWYNLEATSISYFQGLANVAYTHNVPLMVAVLVDCNGNMLQSNLNFFHQINFHQ